MRMMRVSLTASLSVFTLAAAAGTIRTVMYAIALKWTLPPADRAGIVAAVETALADAGY